MNKNGMIVLHSRAELLDRTEARELQIRSLYNNSYFFSPYLEEGLAIEKVLMQRMQNGIVCYFDIGRYYRLILSTDIRQGYRVPLLDKPICFEFIAPGKEDEKLLEAYQKFLGDNGFAFYEKMDQICFNLSDIHLAGISMHRKDLGCIREEGLNLSVVSMRDVPQIERKICEAINEYDIMGYTREEWARQIDAGDILGLYDKDGAMVAFKCFTMDGGRSYVDPIYRRKGLGAAINRLYYAQPRWEGMRQTVHTWIRGENTASNAMFRHALGDEKKIVRTGKTKYRYVKPTDRHAAIDG